MVQLKGLVDGLDVEVKKRKVIQRTLEVLPTKLAGWKGHYCIGNCEWWSDLRRTFVTLDLDVL